MKVYCLDCKAVREMNRHLLREAKTTMRIEITVSRQRLLDTDNAYSLEWDITAASTSLERWHLARCCAICNSDAVDTLERLPAKRSEEIQDLVWVESAITPF